MATRSDEHTSPDGYAGRLLIAGCAFLVTGAMWIMLGFFYYVGDQTALGVVDTVLSVAHFAAGIAILRHERRVWYAGLALAVLGLIAAIPHGYALPAVVEAIAGLLLLFSRRDLAPRDSTTTAS